MYGLLEFDRNIGVAEGGEFRHLLGHFGGVVLQQAGPDDAAVDRQFLLPGLEIEKGGYSRGDPGRCYQERAALADAKFPVAGLGFGDGCVTYKDIPLSQASSAEQIRVSMAIAMATNPDLKVIHIAAGSLLDSEGMNIIKEMAESGDYQVWIEKVDESGKVGIVFEDGEIVAVNEEVEEDVDMSDF